MIDYVVSIKYFIIGRGPAACYAVPKRIPQIAGINNKEVIKTLRSITNNE